MSIVRVPQRNIINKIYINMLLYIHTLYIYYKELAPQLWKGPISGSAK